MSDHPEGSAVTVKEELYAACPPTVTENVPELAPEGTITTMPLSLQLVAVALVPFNATVLLPWLAPNPLPLISTGMPTTPLDGKMLVIVGD
jgi:hypothetical protein